jgi:serine protease AprX
MNSSAAASITGFDARRAVAALAAFAMCVGLLAASWQPSQPIRPGAAPAAGPVAAAPALVALAEIRPAQAVQVIVRLAPGAPAEQLVRTAGGTLAGDLPLINGVVAHVSAAGAMRLATEPGVQHVSLDAIVRPTTETIPVTSTEAYEELENGPASATGAASAWNAKRATGKGIGVAVIDTGIAGQVPDFNDADGSSRVIAEATINPGATRAGDRLGHGTHIAGLIGGNSLNRNDALKGRYMGVAPEANLIDVNVAADDGSTTISDVINGMAFVAEKKDELGIRVVNISLNSTVAEPAATDPLDAAVEVLWKNGLVVVTAAGNRGTAADATHYAPANSPYAIVVGALDDQGTKSMNDDVPATWSSRGATQDGLQKPDVSTAGARLISVLAPGAAYADQCPSCVVDGAYLRLGGTSMAAAVASGAVADLLHRRPEFTPDQVKGALMETARKVGDARQIKVGSAIGASGRTLANQSVPANTQSTILPRQGDFSSLLDWTRMSFTRMSFTRMSFTSVPEGEAKNAPWTRMSFTCDCRPLELSEQQAAGIDETRMSFTRMSFTRMSFTRMSFTTSFDK